LDRSENFHKGIRTCELSSLGAQEAAGIIKLFYVDTGHYIQHVDLVYIFSSTYELQLMRIIKQTFWKLIHRTWIS